MAATQLKVWRLLYSMAADSFLPNNSECCCKASLADQAKNGIQNLRPVAYISSMKTELAEGSSLRVSHIHSNLVARAISLINWQVVVNRMYPVKLPGSVVEYD